MANEVSVAQSRKCTVAVRLSAWRSTREVLVQPKGILGSAGIEPWCEPAVDRGLGAC